MVYKTVDQQEAAMKIRELSMAGIMPISAKVLEARNGAKYFAITHGQTGRGRWQVRFPLAREFPVPSDKVGRIEMTGDYKLVDLRKKDPAGNDLYLIAKGNNDEKQLIFWHLDPGYRGGATYMVSGNAKVISKGHQAQGATGRMRGAPCPVVLVSGPCSLDWKRGGRLYGSDPEWVASYDGNEWFVGPKSECALEEAVLNY
jgi:hypothetical protein